MFNSQIVLIIGAGASFDKYGLLLGGQLASKIARDTNFRFEDVVNRPVQGDADLFDTVIYRKFAHDRAALDRYTDAGHRLAAALGSTVSVDDALYQLSDYPEAVQLGKICIMRSILEAERNSPLLKIEPKLGEPSPNSRKDGWIEQLFSMAITGFKLNEIRHAFKRITFVNFNYDRCIEHYLFWSLQRLGLSSNDASETIQSLNVIRPYGTLGSILPGTPSYLKFGASPPADMFNVIGRIRTFTESDVLHDKEKLSSALSGASLIAFLGFGFHPQNLKLLSLPPNHPFRRIKVLATVHGVHEANLPELTSTLYSSLRVDGHSVETHTMEASEILEKLRMKIMTTVG